MLLKLINVKNTMEIDVDNDSSANANTIAALAIPYYDEKILSFEAFTKDFKFVYVEAFVQFHSHEFSGYNNITKVIQQVIWKNFNCHYALARQAAVAEAVRVAFEKAGYNSLKITRLDIKADNDLEKLDIPFEAVTKELKFVRGKASLQFHFQGVLNHCDSYNFRKDIKDNVTSAIQDTVRKLNDDDALVKKSEIAKAAAYKANKVCFHWLRKKSIRIETHIQNLDIEAGNSEISEEQIRQIYTVIRSLEKSPQQRPLPHPGHSPPSFLGSGSPHDELDPKLKRPADKPNIENALILFERVDDGAASPQWIRSETSYEFVENLVGGDEKCWVLKVGSKIQGRVSSDMQLELVDDEHRGYLVWNGVWALEFYDDIDYRNFATVFKNCLLKNTGTLKPVDEDRVKGYGKDAANDSMLEDAEDGVWKSPAGTRSDRNAWSTKTVPSARPPSKADIGTLNRDDTALDAQSKRDTMGHSSTDDGVWKSQAEMRCQNNACSTETASSAQPPLNADNGTFTRDDTAPDGHAKRDTAETRCQNNACTAQPPPEEHIGTANRDDTSSRGDTVLDGHRKRDAMGKSSRKNVLPVSRFDIGSSSCLRGDRTTTDDPSLQTHRSIDEWIDWSKALLALSASALYAAGSATPARVAYGLGFVFSLMAISLCRKSEAAMRILVKSAAVACAAGVLDAMGEDFPRKYIVAQIMAFLIIAAVVAKAR